MDEFLREYEALCEKHGIIIDSCGCCRSPWPAILDVDTDKTLADHMEHLRKQA